MKKMLLLANFLALSIAEIKKITIENSAKEQFVVFENAESIGIYRCVFYIYDTTHSHTASIFGSKS